MTQYNPSHKAKSIFGLILSVNFSLAMNLIFLIYYEQPFDVYNWLLQLPFTIPTGSIVGVSVGIFLSKKAPNATPLAKGFLFSVLMSVVMSLIMIPFALIPRIGFHMVILAKAALIGIPVGVAV